MASLQFRYLHWAYLLSGSKTKMRSDLGTLLESQLALYLHGPEPDEPCLGFLSAASPPIQKYLLLSWSWTAVPWRQTSREVWKVVQFSWSMLQMQIFFCSGRRVQRRREEGMFWSMRKQRGDSFMILLTCLVFSCAFSRSSKGEMSISWWMFWQTLKRLELLRLLCTRIRFWLFLATISSKKCVISQFSALRSTVAFLQKWGHPKLLISWDLSSRDFFRLVSSLLSSVSFELLSMRISASIFSVTIRISRCFSLSRSSFCLLISLAMNSLVLKGAMSRQISVY